MGQTGDVFFDVCEEEETPPPSLFMSEVWPVRLLTENEQALLLSLSAC